MSGLFGSAIVAYRFSSSKSSNISFLVLVGVLPLILGCFGLNSDSVVSAFFISAFYCQIL